MRLAESTLLAPCGHRIAVDGLLLERASGARVAHGVPSRATSFELGTKRWRTGAHS